MVTEEISPKTTISELLARWPQAIDVFLKRRMICVGCGLASFETLEDAAQNYAIPVNDLTGEVRRIIPLSQPPDQPHTPSGTNIQYKSS
jgi:hybrid cluster-associated redox disulfide protein